MRSATSFFDLTLYKKDLSRFWPLWSLYTVLWLFLLPLNLLSSASYNRNFDVARWAGREPAQIVGDMGGLVIAVCYGLVCAAAVWCYLYNNRSANLMHSLPARRENHFLTHTLAGVTFFVLPHVIIFVLTLLAELMCGAVHVGVLASAMLAQTLLCLFFFAFATLCAMLTGHILGLPAFYAIFNLIVYVMTTLAEWLCNFFLFGYSGGLTNVPIVRILTPVWLIGEGFSARQVYEIDPATGQYLLDPLTGNRISAGYYELQGLGLVAIVALVGVVMLAAALLLYRRRHMESAGDTVAVPALRPVFLYCMGICGSLAGGCATYLVLGLETLAFLVLSLMIWGIIFYFAGLMLLHKSFRVFKAGWWGCGVTLCAVLALCGSLQIDLFGVESRVPDADQVAAVHFSGVESAPYDRGSYMNADAEDPETIRKAIAVHQAIVDDRHYLQNWAEEYAANGHSYTAEQQAASEEGLARTSDFTVRYTLKNGRTLSRTYNYLWLEYGHLSDPTSLEARLTELANDRTAQRQRYRLDELDKGKLVSVSIEDAASYAAVFLKVPGSDVYYEAPRYYLDGMDEKEYQLYLDKYAYESTLSYEEIIAGAVAVPLPTTDAEGGIKADLTELFLTEAQADAIKQALLGDFNAGNLGVRYLFDGDPARSENIYSARIEVSYESTAYRHYYDGGEEYTQPYTSTNSFTIALTPQAKATIAALKAAGAFADSGVELRTDSGAVHTP